MTIKTMDCFFLSFIFIFLLALEEGLFSNRNIRQILKIYMFYFFVYSFIASPSTSLIVLIQVYNWEIRHHSLVCRCGLADFLYILEFNQP